jgi:HK97 gp10 family phage protein
MANQAGLEVQVRVPSLQDLREALKGLPNRIAAKHLGAALRKSAKYVETALKKNTPVGPTGNLKRSITTKIKTYPRDGNAVAVVGYMAAGSGKSKSAAGGKVKKGKDRAFHQGLIEFGTKDRKVNKPAAQPYQRVVGKKAFRVNRQGGYIASSFNTLGPFRLAKKSGLRVRTMPGYPNAFFFKSNQPITIRGVTPQHPVRTSWMESKSAAQSALKEALNLQISKALGEVAFLVGKGKG